MTKVLVWGNLGLVVDEFLWPKLNCVSDAKILVWGGLFMCAW